LCEDTEAPILRRVYLQNLPKDASGDSLSNFILKNSGLRVGVIKSKGQSHALVFCEKSSDVAGLIDKIDGQIFESKRISASKRLSLKTA
jgi:hypothetical protein